MDSQLSLFEEPVYNLIVGADEAGRGPLAGPVCAAAVVLPSDFPFEILADSKALSEKKRLLAEPIIKEKAIAWAIAWGTPAEIDSINILNASLLAMKRAYLLVEKQLASKGLSPDILLVDGNKRPDVPIACQAIVKGDAKVHEIMAASILAKNARDRIMVLAAKRWPQYGFEKHKGYPCASHKAALHAFGPCPIHRLTFKY
ncbi:MAG: ribonuclease HII [Spirochaetales bacterium]|nr:ribonuclease HII [Spirochaetales bacterium]